MTDRTVSFRCTAPSPHAVATPEGFNQHVQMPQGMNTAVALTAAAAFLAEAEGNGHYIEEGTIVSVVGDGIVEVRFPDGETWIATAD